MDEIEKAARLFKALSDPTRLTLFTLLKGCSKAECKAGLCVNALARQVGVTQSAVSQHLRVLRQVGLVRGERRGNFVHYSVDPEGLEQYDTVLAQTLGGAFQQAD